MHRSLFVCSFFFIVIAAHSQYYSDDAFTARFGVSGGAMNCLTDLGGKSNVLKTFKPAGGFYVGAFYQRAVGARLELTWGSITAADRFSKKTGVTERNLSFSSDITEISLLAEVHPLDFFPAYDLPFSLYLLGGVGSFSFSPKTKIQGGYVFLQPLHTEGEGFVETGRPNYKLSQFNLPVGGGLSYEISPLFTVKGELVYRVLSTDYLDDVSTTYIDLSLFDKNLPANVAALAKQLYYRTGEIKSNAPVPTEKYRGNTIKDSYYSLNVKLELTLGSTRR